MSSSTPHNAEAGPSSPHEGKKRSKQPQLSCAECRRLKLKCNREIPCSNCIRRKCANLCPDGVKETRKHSSDIKATELLQKRLSTLESLLADHGLDVPSPTETDPVQSPQSSQVTGKRRRESSDHSHPHSNTRYPDHHHHHHHSPSGTVAGPSSSSRYHSPSTNTSTRPPISATREFPFPTPKHTDSIQSSSTESHTNYWTRETSDYRSHPLQPQPQPPPPHRPPPISPHNRSSDNMMASSTSMVQMDGGIPPIQPRSPPGHSHGTLVIGQEGRSRYLGPTAGTEWLKNQELGESNSPEPRGTPSPEDPPSQDNPEEREKRNATEHLLAFPFPLPNGPSTMEALLSHLPQRDDAENLMDSYYRYFAWNHDTAPRRFFQPIFDRIYQCISTKTYRKVHPQQLALLFSILAMGTLQNLELPPNDPTADEYLSLAKGCLTKGDFLNNNTIAGVQTLIIMAHYLLETEKGRNGDSAWPLWGLAMRIIVAMGLHRDGARWNLPADVVEERRQVFWAAYAIEILQANCFSRPTSLALQYIDTAFPVGPSDHPEGSKSYQTLRFELIRLSAKILDTGMSVHFESYDNILTLFNALCQFERSIPFDLRCRTAMLSLPSEYPDQNFAIKQSPEISRRNIKRTFQQFTLALNVSEHVLFLHRPYFVMAMHDQPLDPTRSVYGKSYLAVIERCSVIIQIVSALYEAHPAVSSRQWFLWYHIFTAAVCLGTMVLRNPTSVLSQFALTSIDQSINVYSSLIKQNNSSSMIQNHNWLVRLRSRAFNKVLSAAEKQQQHNHKRHKANDKEDGTDEEDRDADGDGDNWEDEEKQGDQREEFEFQRQRKSSKHRNSINSSSEHGDQPNTVNGNGTGSVNGEEDMDIVGWKTRLIESAANGTQIGINISSTSSNTPSRQLQYPQQHQGQSSAMPALNNIFSPPILEGGSTSSSNNGVAPAVQQVLQQHLVGTDGISIPNNEIGIDSSTDLMLHQFWDPMMLNEQNDLSSANWWSWM